MGNKVNRYVYWVPRIATIFFIFFIMMFSLDVFEGNGNFKNTLYAFFMHNLPALVLAIVLVISWKVEIVGGIFFILSGLVYLFFAIRNPNISFGMSLIWFATIGLPIMVIGFLFLVNWIQKRRLKKNIE